MPIAKRGPPRRTARPPRCFISFVIWFVIWIGANEIDQRRQRAEAL
jgi:hypothetical protein